MTTADTLVGAIRDPGGEQLLLERELEASRPA